MCVVVATFVMFVCVNQWICVWVTATESHGESVCDCQFVVVDSVLNICYCMITFWLNLDFK